MVPLVKPQYIIDEKGNRVSVIIPIDEYERIIEELEDLDDVRLYDAAKKRAETSISLKQYEDQRSLKSR